MAPERAEVKYARIAADLRLRIASGELALGDRVPSEPALCDQYGVSKMTAARALDILAAEGTIVRRTGAGSFVAAIPQTDVVEVGPGTRITARGSGALNVERPGAAVPEQYRADTTIILVTG